MSIRAIISGLVLDCDGVLSAKIINKQIDRAISAIKAELKKDVTVPMITESPYSKGINHCRFLWLISLEERLR